MLIPQSNYIKNQMSVGSWKTLLFLLFLGIFQSCVEAYEPDISKYESLLVVDAFITDQKGSGHVTISKTYPYNDAQDTYVDGAMVKLIDEFGAEYSFDNDKKGSYIISDSLFVAQVGEKYKIYIETPDGSVCESSYETLTEPIPIDNMYYKFIDSNNDKTKGLQILIDVENVQNKGTYFAWEYTETWEFEVPFISPYVPNSQVCFKTVKPAVFLIQSTKEFSRGSLMKYPLYFIDNTTNRLYIKYSVLVSQYTLTESTYTFLNELKEINEEQGTLFDKAPLTLIGNLTNLIDPNKPVLGNFQASAVYSKRIFLKKKDLPFQLNVPNGFDYCEGENLSILNDKVRLDSLLRSSWLIIDTIIYTNPIDTLVGIAIARSCFDCKVNGSILKPVYWDEE